MVAGYREISVLEDLYNDMLYSGSRGTVTHDSIEDVRKKQG